MYREVLNIPTGVSEKSERMSIMGSKNVLRRDFLRQSGLAAAGVAAVPLVGGAAGWASGAAKSGSRDTNILLTGDIHFDLPGDHHWEWVEEVNHKAAIDMHCARTARTFKPLMETLKNQALAANPPASAVVQLGDLQEGMAGSPEMASQLTRHTLEAIEAPQLPVPWVLVQGNHGLQGPGAKEAYKAQVVPYLQKELDPSITSMNYSYHIGDAHIVVLDHFNNPDGFIDFLEAELEASTARYKFVAIHEPVIPISSLCWHCLMRMEDFEPPRQRLLEVLARNQAIVLCGHIHRYSVLRRMTACGPIVQVMISSIVSEVDKKQPTDRIMEYGPETLRQGRNWRPETLGERQALLTEEGKHITDFFSYDLQGYAMLTLGSGEEDKIELSYYGGLNKEPYETVDLAALLEAE